MLHFAMLDDLCEFLAWLTRSEGREYMLLDHENPELRGAVKGFDRKVHDGMLLARILLRCLALRVFRLLDSEIVDAMYGSCPSDGLCLLADAFGVFGTTKRAHQVVRVLWTTLSISNSNGLSISIAGTKAWS